MGRVLPWERPKEILLKLSVGHLSRNLNYLSLSQKTLQRKLACWDKVKQNLKIQLFWNYSSLIKVRLLRWLFSPWDCGEDHLLGSPEAWVSGPGSPFLIKQDISVSLNVGCFILSGTPPIYRAWAGNSSGHPLRMALERAIGQGCSKMRKTCAGRNRLVLQKESIMLA